MYVQEPHGHCLAFYLTCLIMTGYDSVFSAVFPPPSDVNVPTPSATPIFGSDGFEESFSSSIPSETATVTGAAEQIKWDRAWHTATAYLSLPNVPITAAFASCALQNEETLKGKWLKPFTTEVSRAVEYVASENSYGRRLRKQLNKDDILQWYYEEMGTKHYLEYVRPGLVKVFSIDYVMEGTYI